MCGRYRRTTQEEELARIYHVPIPMATVGRTPLRITRFLALLWYSELSSMKQKDGARAPPKNQRERAEVVVDEGLTYRGDQVIIAGARYSPGVGDLIACL